MVNSANSTLKYIESYVLLTTLLVAFLTVFGSWRRRSHSLNLKYSIWSSYLLSTFLINYTMGLMKSATFRDELFAVWATFLIIFLGSADCISAYSLEDSENRKRYNLELFVQYFWLGWLIGLHANKAKFAIPLYVLYFLSLRRTGGRAEALELASKSYGLVSEEDNFGFRVGLTGVIRGPIKDGPIVCHPYGTKPNMKCQQV